MSVLTSSLVFSALGLSPSSWGSGELLLLFAVILIFFGPKRLPQLSRSIGKAIHDFKRGLSDMKDDIERAGEDEEDQEPRAKVPPTVVEKSEGEAEKNVVAPPAHSKHV